jgi:hypothetical protein
VQLSRDGDLTHAITLTDEDSRWREQLRGFHIDRVRDKLSLERAGLFLCAQPDRATTACDRLEKHAWETFTLVPARP